MENNTIIQVGTIIIALLGAVITYILIPYFKSKTTQNQRDNISFWMQMAILSAEKVFSLPKSGAEKKQFVIDFLISKGIKLTTEEFNVLIDAFVEKVINAPKVALEVPIV